MTNKYIAISPIGYKEEIYGESFVEDLDGNKTVYDSRNKPVAIIPQTWLLRFDIRGENK